MAKRILEISPVKGGALSASLSTQNVGEQNYVEKVNWRREKDQEVRREGWFLYEPIDGPANQDVFDATDKVIKLAEIVRPDGTREIVGASRTEIKRFNNTTGAWDDIGIGFSASGKRWQVVSMNGYLAFNNTVDLPVTYYVGDDGVTAMYELRQRGVASVGRMEQSNGFILFADIVEFAEGQLAPWMNGYTAGYPITHVEPIVGDYTVISPGQLGWHFTMDNTSTSTINLPASPDPGFYFWLSYSSYDPVGNPTEINPPVSGIPPVLDVATTMVLVTWDQVAGNWYATSFPTGVIPGDNPYGPVPESLGITNRFPWRVINGEFADPRRWAPIFSAYLTASTNTFDLPFEPVGYIPGVTRVAVINGGPGGGILGGQTGYENGILVTAVTGKTIQLEIPTDAAISYPRIVSVTKYSDLSSLSASYDLQDDGSLIHGLKVLQNLVIVYRKTGIYVGRYTGISTDSLGNTTGPFNFTPRYRGFNIPLWGDCIADVNGEYHLYPAEGNRWYMFDGNTNPRVHPITDLARNLFFNGIDPDTYEPWAIESPLTKEQWFFRNGKVFCYDFEHDTVSIIDAEIDSAVFALKPETTTRWFILGIANLISVYGLVEEYDPPLSFRTWLRRGQPAYPVIKSGLISANDQYNEKTLTSFVPIMATLSPDITWTVELFGCWNPSVTPVALLDQPEVLPTPSGENLVACFFQSLYFQFKITVDGTVDADARYTASLMEVDRVDAGRVNTRVDQ